MEQGRNQFSSNGRHWKELEGLKLVLHWSVSERIGICHVAVEAGV